MGASRRPGRTLLKLLNLELQTHPFSVLRAAALTQWVDSGGYGAIMAGDYPRRTDEGQTKFTDDIGSAARHYKDSFDHSDDPLIRGVCDGVTGIVDRVGHAATSAVDAMGRKISEWRSKPSDTELITIPCGKSATSARMFPMSDLDSKLRPIAEALLAPGEELWGYCVATQAGMFTGRQVLLAVTGGRLIVQYMNRKFEPAGDTISLPPERIANASVEGAGGGWPTVGLAIMDGAAVTLKMRTADGEKLKLIMMRGTGVFGKLGGGETQQHGVEALATWLPQHLR